MKSVLVVLIVACVFGGFLAGPQEEEIVKSFLKQMFGKFCDTTQRATFDKCVSEMPKEHQNKMKYEQLKQGEPVLCKDNKVNPEMLEAVIRGALEELKTKPQPTPAEAEAFGKFGQCLGIKLQ